MRAAKQTSTANQLLAAVPRHAYQRMLIGLEPVELTYGQVLYEPAGRIRHVYFPTGSLVSLLTAVDKNRTLEVGMVGNEGMVGMPMALGIGLSAVRALVQGSGPAMRMSAARFRTEFSKNRPFQRAHIARLEPAWLAHDLKQKLNVIAARGMREFVNETLNGPTHRVRTRRTP